MILHTKETIQDVISFKENTDLYSSTSHHLYDYRAPGNITRKPSICPTETEQCLPRNVASSSQNVDPETCDYNVHVIVLTEFQLVS